MRRSELAALARATRAVAALAVLAAVSGCATFGSRTPASLSADSVDERTRVEIADRPPVPGLDEMLPAAQLVSFEYRRADGGTARDTVIGASRVSSWLASLRARTERTRYPFLMETREILVCDGAAVERGRFPLPGRVLGGRGDEGREQAYTILWRPVGDRWRIESIWLIPPSAAGPQTHGCRGPRMVIEGWAVGINGGIGAAADPSGFEAYLRDRYFEQVYAKTSQAWAQLWIARRITPRIHAVVTVGTLPTASVTGINEHTNTMTTRSYEIRTVASALMAEYRHGPLAAAAGPAVGTVVVDMFHQTLIGSRLNPPVTRSASDYSFGAAARLSARRTFPAGILATAWLGYWYFPDVEATAEIPAPVGLGGPIFGLGVAWAVN